MLVQHTVRTNTNNLVEPILDAEIRAGVWLVNTQARVAQPAP